MKGVVFLIAIFALIFFMLNVLALTGEVVRGEVTTGDVITGSTVTGEIITGESTIDTLNFTIVIGDSTAPNFTKTQTNNTVVGLATNFSTFYFDRSNLNPNGQFIFSINQTGAWVNDSAKNFTTKSQWANVTKLLNSTVGAVVGYQWYADDNAGNSNNTQIFKLTTTEAPSDDSSPAASGGGGGGGTTTITPAPSKPKPVLELKPGAITLTLKKGETKSAELTIKNLDSLTRIIEFEVSGIEELLELKETTLTLRPGEEQVIPLEFFAKENIPFEVYIGSLIAKSGTFSVKTSIIIAFESEEQLFDVILEIPRRSLNVVPGEDVTANINLFEIVQLGEVEVTINYVIKDFNGNVYFSKSETITVFGQQSIEKIFPTKNLPVGDYVLGIELIYPGGVAVASSQFKVLDESEILANRIILGAIIVVLFVVFVGMYWMIERYKKIGRRIIRRR